MSSFVVSRWFSSLETDSGVANCAPEKNRSHYCGTAPPFSASAFQQAPTMLALAFGELRVEVTLARWLHQCFQSWHRLPMGELTLSSMLFSPNVLAMRRHLTLVEPAAHEEIKGSEVYTCQGLAVSEMAAEDPRTGKRWRTAGDQGEDPLHSSKNVRKLSSLETSCDKGSGTKVRTCTRLRVMSLGQRSRQESRCCLPSTHALANTRSRVPSDGD